MRSTTGSEYQASRNGLEPLELKFQASLLSLCNIYLFVDNVCNELDTIIKFEFVIFVENLLILKKLTECFNQRQI
ncbi:hypothetical protein DERP_000281 [Dermatophagoides pteronyssinus]|uniref:Uncharacterized protein n=1 Tax=Dermatophagoides pteronyssinus TaxID=6956 RepID=A0ABQ8IZQ6_DERPT|nr:hypothetical protein DERP_000281 [Dermatophagoides pteronyssinus]